MCATRWPRRSTAVPAGASAASSGRRTGSERGGRGVLGADADVQSKPRGRLRGRPGRVWGRDDAKVLYLGWGSTSVSFKRPGESVTLLLDGRPPALADDGEPAEIELVLDDEQAARFLAGRLNVPLALLA